jgi:hypothetical protein
MGMRKDSIVSEEEKQRRKKRLEENRNITSKRLSNLESISHTFEEINHVSFYILTLILNYREIEMN